MNRQTTGILVSRRRAHADRRGRVGMALLAISFAERPATPERTYGFYRTTRSDLRATR